MLLATVVIEFINGALIIILGLLTLLHNPRGKANRSLAFFSLASAVWSVSWAIQAPIQDKASALFWARMLNFGAIFIPVLFLQWILILLDIDRQKKNRIVLRISYLLTLFFAFFGFSPYFIATVRPEYVFPYYAQPGPLHPLYIFVCWGGIVGYTIYNLLKAYSNKETSILKKAQIRYVFLGMLIGFGGGATNYFLLYNIPIPNFGNFLVAIGVGFFDYSIIRYRLMDIRWVLGRVGIYFLSFSTIILYVIGLTRWKQIAGTFIPWMGFVVFVSITAILIFLYLFRVYEKIAGKYFYYTVFTLQQAIKKLRKRLNQTIELDKLANLVDDSLLDALGLGKIATIVRVSGTKHFRIQQLIQFQQEEISSLLHAKGAFLTHYFEDTQEPIIREEVPFVAKKIGSSKDPERRIKVEQLNFLLREMNKAKIGIFLPLFIKKKLIGVIILGDKLSNNSYSMQDIHLLENISPQISIAVNNALSYEEILSNRAELEKWYHATIGRELRMIELKKKIKELDKENLELKRR